MQNITIDFNNLQESMKDLMNAVADEATASTSKEEMESLNRMTSNEQNKEKTQLIEKLRASLKKLEQLNFTPKKFLLGLIYKSDETKATNNVKARRVIEGFGRAFNIAIDYGICTIQLLINFISYIVQTIATYALHIVRKVVNTLLHLQAVEL